MKYYMYHNYNARLYPFSIMSNALVMMHNLTCINHMCLCCFKFLLYCLYCFGSLMLFKISPNRRACYSKLALNVIISCKHIKISHNIIVGWWFLFKTSV